MFGKTKIQNSNVWKRQSSEFQCSLEKPKARIPMFGKAKFRIPMFGKGKNQNSNFWNSQNSESQCLEKPKTRIPIFGKAKISNPIVWKSKNPEFQSLEKPKFRILMFGKAIMQNSNVRKTKNPDCLCLEKSKISKSSVWKRQNFEFQCLEKLQFRIPICGKAKIQNSNLSGRPRLVMLKEEFSLYFCSREDDILNSLIQNKLERS